MDNEHIEPHEELAELLNGEEKEDLNNPPPEPEEEPKGEKEPESEEVKAESEEEPEKPVEEVPPTSEDEDRRFQAMLAKSQDEVSKRQLAEAENARLRQELEQAKQQQIEPIDPLENPEGYRQQIAEAQLQQQQNDQLARIRDKVAMSEMVVKTSVGAEKYDEATKAFAEAAQLNPALGEAMYQADIPAQFAYDEGRKILFMQKIGDNPDNYEANIREQVRKELEAEYAKKAEAAQYEEQSQALPKTIANAGTAAPSSAELPDDSLESLLNS